MGLELPPQASGPQNATSPMNQLVLPGVEALAPPPELKMESATTSFNALTRREGMPDTNRPSPSAPEGTRSLRLAAGHLYEEHNGQLKHLGVVGVLGPGHERATEIENSPTTFTGRMRLLGDDGGLYEIGFDRNQGCCQMVKLNREDVRLPGQLCENVETKLGVPKGFEGNKSFQPVTEAVWIDGKGGGFAVIPDKGYEIRYDKSPTEQARPTNHADLEKLFTPDAAGRLDPNAKVEISGVEYRLAPDSVRPVTENGKTLIRLLSSQGQEVKVMRMTNSSSPASYQVYRRVHAALPVAYNEAKWGVEKASVGWQLDDTVQIKGSADLAPAAPPPAASRPVDIAPPPPPALEAMPPSPDAATGAAPLRLQPSRATSLLRQ